MSGNHNLLLEPLAFTMQGNGHSLLLSYQHTSLLLVCNSKSGMAFLQEFRDVYTGTDVKFRVGQLKPGAQYAARVRVGSKIITTLAQHW